MLAITAHIPFSHRLGPARQRDQRGQTGLRRTLRDQVGAASAPSPLHRHDDEGHKCGEPMREAEEAGMEGCRHGHKSAPPWLRDKQKGTARLSTKRVTLSSDGAMPCLALIPVGPVAASWGAMLAHQVAGRGSLDRRSPAWGSTRGSRSVARSHLKTSYPCWMRIPILPSNAAELRHRAAMSMSWPRRQAHRQPRPGPAAR
ncbi:hypothetical protein FHS67_004381 [Aminobacter aminovorans]|uniref:Uncharacterized protein n=1 Tax=Aminobacter aminovorans TaxID=83263 RepID=A0ABR6HBY4_AMIAI|nr:hypothetical protein [Aminobacter aminovorans]